MEEVVSTALEHKHRFMVDVVLFMGILEDEHVRLEDRINNFTGERWRGGANRQDSMDEDVEDEEDEEEVRQGLLCAMSVLVDVGVVVLSCLSRLIVSGFPLCRRNTRWKRTWARWTHRE